MPTGTKPTVEAMTELHDYLCDAEPKTDKHGEKIEALRAALSAAIDAAQDLELYESEAERIGWKSQDYSDRAQAFYEKYNVRGFSIKQDEDGNDGEAYFSRNPRDCCGTMLAGNRYDVDSYQEGTGEILEFTVCPDCIHYDAYGDLPED